MTTLAKVMVINGEYKGETGTLTGMFWTSNIAIVITDDGRELAVNPRDIVKVYRKWTGHQN